MKFPKILITLVSSALLISCSNIKQLVPSLTNSSPEELAFLCNLSFVKSKGMVIPANTVLTIRYAPETGNSENSVHYATQTYFIGDQLGVTSCTAHKLNLGWLRLHARDVTSSFTVKPTKEGYTFTLNSQSAVATILNGGIQVLHEGQSFPSNNSRILGAPFPQSNMTNGENFTPSKDK